VDTLAVFVRSAVLVRPDGDGTTGEVRVVATFGNRPGVESNLPPTGPLWIYLSVAWLTTRARPADAAMSGESFGV
jgi:hypothetical protein